MSEYGEAEALPAADADEVSSVHGHSDDSDDEEEDLILFARVARLDNPAGNKSALKQQQRLQTKLEKQREVERAQKEEERKQLAKERQAKQRQSKTEKRLLFTLESLRVADSHVATVAADLSDTGAQADAPPETSADLKKLYSEAYALAQGGKGQEALPKLELALETAEKQNNRVVAFSSAALLGEESLKLGSTRRAIECLESALASALTLPHVTPEQKKYLLARLQSAFVDVGDVERANEVLAQYGTEVGASSPRTSRKSGGTAASLPASAAASLDAALESAVARKDLEPLRMLVLTLRQTPAASAVARHGHPSTGITALHAAAGRNDAELVRELIVMGAAVDGKDALGQNPLVWAARYGGGDALEALVKAGARFDAELSASEVEKWPSGIKQRVKELIASTASS